MKSIRRHITRCLLAGAVAVLPIAGLIITVGYVESRISSSGLAKLPYYFPGFGLLASVIIIYLIGLVVSTFIGRWLWSRLDSLLDRVPALGGLYQTFKQILGYGEGEDAIFQEVVLVPGRDNQSEELGLVTNRVLDQDGSTKLLIFVPASPVPTTGRLVVMDPETVRPLEMPVSETLKALVAMGKTDVRLDTVVTRPLGSNGAE
ncbi:MAG: DUF502 domain-containing protein [Planctomycetes bacterium]|nr:DUF502 domain-containing protein [Planctomycetota bacterium]MBL7038857.1 DUF502 domain-containing protein [Pirellulaceae bacterium]